MKKELRCLKDITEEEKAQALEDSIQHWTRLSEGTAGPAETIFGDSCALCALFYETRDTIYDKFTYNCLGCPIYKRTGKSECHDTPWYKVCAAYNGLGVNTEAFKAAAREQLAFLISLRKPVESKQD